MSSRSKFLMLWLAFGALAACVLGGWWAWQRYFSDEIVPSKEEFPLRGIDISAHNGEIDFESLARENPVDFVYVKATEGTDFLDRNYEQNILGASRQGIPTGAYHFFRFDTDGEMQALNFLSALRGRRFRLPPAIDIEEWGNPDGHATALIVNRLRDMVSYMEHEGYAPMLYTNRDGYRRFIRGNFDSYPLWLCSFADPLPLGMKPDIWQYSHRGSLPGISGRVDLDAAPSALLRTPSK